MHMMKKIGEIYAKVKKAVMPKVKPAPKKKK